MGQYAKYGAWLAALTEFVGGLLILIGFLSRVWGLGLAITMGMAFYLTTMKSYGFILDEPNPLVFTQNTPHAQGLAAQLGLFVLAFGLFLTGPGPLSLDRLLFGRRSSKNDVYVIGDSSDQGSTARRPM